MGLDALSKSGKFGKIVAKLMESYRKRITEMLIKIIKTEGEGLIEIIDHIKDDIIKIISGGHIDVLNDEELANPLDDLWKRFIDYLKKQGKVKIAEFLDKYKGKIEEMVKDIIKKEGKEPIIILEQIRDAIIKIITGNDIEMMDDEVLGNIFEDLWKKMLDALSKSGKFGNIVARLMESYRKRITEMLIKIIKTEGEGLIEIIDHIKDDIIKIISGGHIDVLND